MQTQFENAKNATALAQVKAKESLEQKEEVLANITVIEKTLKEKEQDLNCNKITLARKQQEIESLNKQIAEQQQLVDDKMAEVDAQREKTRQVRHSMCNFFDLGQHDLNFVANARTFNFVQKAQRDAAAARAN